MDFIEYLNGIFTFLLSLAVMFASAFIPMHIVNKVIGINKGYIILTMGILGFIGFWVIQYYQSADLPVLVGVIAIISIFVYMKQIVIFFFNFKEKLEYLTKHIR